MTAGNISPEQRLELQRIWDALLRYALWKGVSFHDAEDLVSNSLRNALEHHDTSRGALLPFCRTILGNAIKNYWRDRKTNLPIDDELWPQPDGEPDIALEEKEKVESMKQTVAQLSKLLSPEELAFMKAMGEVVDEIGDRAVSETSRRLGMKPAKGWDLFRRIQRKARSLEPPAPRRAAERVPMPPAPKKPGVKENEIMASLDQTPPDRSIMASMRAPMAMSELPGETGSDTLFAIAGAMAREEGFGRFLKHIGYPMPNS